MSRRIGLRGFAIVLIALVVAFAAPITASSQVHVRGYYRKNGTYVQPHVRSNPDGNFSNNWSTKGNVNPYTGKEGTRVTPPAGYGGSYRGEPYMGSPYASSSYFGGYSMGDETSSWIDNPHYSGVIPNLRTTIEPTDNKLQEIAALNYHGIGFSTTHEQFLQLFPNAKPASPVDSAGVVSYAIEDLDGKRDAIWFQFLDGEFLRLVFSYGETRVKQYGGTNVLSNRAKQRFGPPTRHDGTTTLWLFPAIDRLVMTGMDGNSWYLVVTRLSGQKAVNGKRAKVDVGF
jgi:hypothetical protein